MAQKHHLRTLNGFHFWFLFRLLAYFYLCQGGYVFVWFSWLVGQFVCQQNYAKSTQPISQNSAERGHTGHGRKRQLFTGNADHVTLWMESGQGYNYGYGQVGAPPYFAWENECYPTFIQCGISGLGGGMPSTKCHSSYVLGSFSSFDPAARNPRIQGCQCERLLPAGRRNCTVSY